MSIAPNPLEEGIDVFNIHPRFNKLVMGLVPSFSRGNGLHDQFFWIPKYLIKRRK